MPVRKILLGSLSVFAIAVFAHCNGADKKSSAVTTETQQEEKKPEVVEQKQETVKYSAWPVKKVDTSISGFKKKYSASEQYLILALNRIDAANIKRADTLIIPDKILGGFIDYTPFPQHLSLLDDVKKIVVFSYPVQAFAAYENGKLVYSGPTSMGSKIHQTPTGLFFANWKAEETISTVDDEWKLKWNFNIENKEGVGWHQYALPGYPASHSCLRMLEADAKWMYEWADQWIVKGENNILAQGTPVIVFGAYPFGTRRPWLHLLDNGQANEIKEGDLNKEIEPVLARIKEQQQRRESVEAGTTTKDTAKSAR